MTGTTQRQKNYYAPFTLLTG